MTSQETMVAYTSKYVAGKPCNEAFVRHFVKCLKVVNRTFHEMAEVECFFFDFFVYTNCIKFNFFISPC